MVNVICMKWGDKYDPQYVNILRNMVRRHLSLPHRFVCFTDDASGLHPGIETFPLPELDLPAGIPERCWRKLCTFEAELGDLRGTTLFLDLDVVIVDSIDCLFEITGPFFICHDYRWHGRLEVTGNSSVYRFVVGEHAHIIEHFRAHQEQVRRQFRHEQAYLSHKMQESGCLNYWPDSWCPSFKVHCMPAFPLRYFREPRIPPGARIVIFHGRPNPPEAAHGLYRGLRKFSRPAKWVTAHWHDNADTQAAGAAAHS